MIDERYFDVRVLLLGSPEILVDGRPVAVGSAKQRALIVALALEANTVVSSDRLVEALWDGRPPESAYPTLRGLVARLRRRLAAEGQVDGVPWLRGRGPGYVLEVDPAGIDAGRFESLSLEGRRALTRGDPARAASDLREALAQWRGPALGEFADWPFARPEARRLDDARLGAVEDLAEAELALGRAGDVVDGLRSHVVAHPLRERAWGQLMLALYRLGRQAEALRAYQQLRRGLAEELGIEPTPGLRQLEARILGQDPELLVEGPPGAPEHPGPPLRHPTPGAPRPRHNLPAALTSFVGRVEEIADIVGLLDRSRLVTLAGPGGAGKTRLALEAAAEALGRFPDGAWLVELAPLRDPDLRQPDLVAHGVAVALGLDPSALAASGRPFDEALCDHLRYRRQLIVMDNCEHLVVPVARLAYTLLTRCPDVAVLATSREVLGVPGERVVRVGPLSLPAGPASDRRELLRSDAVTLFCERAGEAQRGFALQEANARAVARICRRLDGIPLALELAAARLPLLGVDSLAERLDDRFRLLDGGPRAVNPRHQTLQAAIDWSYELLSDSERVVLRRLAIFPATFDLDAAEAVAAGGGGLEGPGRPEVLGIVGRLADKSLVIASPAGGPTTGGPAAGGSAPGGSAVRHRLLETVRQYAADRLVEAGEGDVVAERHRDFFTPPGRAWFLDVADGRRLRWAEAETDNLRAALAWSGGRGDDRAILRLAAPLWLYWLFSGTVEATDWLERAVAARPPADVALRVHARIGLGLALRNLGGDEHGRSARLMDEALALALEHGDELAAAWARFQLAELAAIDGRYGEHEALLAQATEAFRATGRPVWEAYASGVMAWASMTRGDFDGARRHLERSLHLAGDADNYLVPHLRGMLALARATGEDHGGAEGMAADAIRAARTLPGRQILVMALTRGAEAAVISRRPEVARGHLDELLGLLRDLGARRWVAEALEASAIVLAPDRPAAAAVVLGSAGAMRGSLSEKGGTLGALSGALEQCTAVVAARLGAGAVEEHAARGADMHLAEILAFAQAELRRGASAGGDMG